MKHNAETTLIMKRTFNAPVATVYKAWPDPQQFSQWMGPQAIIRCDVEAYDVQAGGHFAFTMTNADGETFGASGQFLQVLENEKLVMTWIWNHIPDNETQLTIKFRGDHAETVLTLMHEKHVSSDSRDNHESGWTRSFDELDKLVVSVTAAVLTVRPDLPKKHRMSKLTMRVSKRDRTVH